MKICKNEQEYIDAIAPAVQRACKRYGYLPSVLIAQSCLENGFGVPDFWDNPQIALLLQANNMVGLKKSLLNSSWDEYTVWPGRSISKQTPEEYGGRMVTITDDFRKYDSIEQSFCDYLLFMKYASNFGKGGVPKYGDRVLSIKDPEMLIKTVSSLGYATGSTYPTSVMRIINRHDLTEYDDLSAVRPTEIVPTSISRKESNIKKLPDRLVVDITARNMAQVPRGRNGNPITYVVCHYLGVPNADNPDLYGGGYGGHYYVSRSGQVFKAANPRTAVTWHCGGGLQGSGGHTFYGQCTNYNSIGIECGVNYTDKNAKDGDGDNNKWYFSEETQESLVWLVSQLMDEYGISFDHVIRHYDVTGKICPNPYVKNNGLNGNWTWDEFKANLKQYRKNGTITIPDQSEAPAPEPQYTPVTALPLVQGNTGDLVREMQTLLNACGYNCGTADGIFGKKTAEALSAFRKANKMTSTPKYTEKVKDALTAAYEATQCLQKGDRGDAVKEMQTMLNAVGYDCGKADGIFGDKTAVALSNFRLAHKMTATPKYTSKVKKALTEEFNNKK